MIYRKDAIDMSLVQCPYEEEQGYIYISDEYTNNILKLSGCNDIDEVDFQTLCVYKFLEPYLYDYTLKSTTNVYYYARYVLGGRFELGEQYIASDAFNSYLYASDVLKGRFELGEPAIAQDSEYSYLYARDVLKGRFELGEPAIATSPIISYRYASDVVKGRFELGEDAISSDTNLKNKYKQLTGVEL